MTPAFIDDAIHCVPLESCEDASAEVEPDDNPDDIIRDVTIPGSRFRECQYCAGGTCRRVLLRYGQAWIVVHGTWRQ